MLKLCFLTIVVVVTSVNAAYSVDGPFPESMVVLRGQPSVFVLVRNADVIIDMPATVSLNLELLKSDLATVKDLGPARSETDRAWTLLCLNPAKYLVASSQLQRLTLENAHRDAGSCFAVSREGIFLTNAHMVNDASASELNMERNVDLLRKRAMQDCQEFEKLLGVTSLPTEVVRKQCDAIMAWYVARSRMLSAKTRSISIILDYRVDSQKLQEKVKQLGLSATLAQPLMPECISVPATVLAAGESMPGKDAAVLKAIFDPAEQAKLLQRNQQQRLPALDAMLAEIQNDRVLCLTLANSDEVLPQARVQALGMPSLGFDSTLMDTDARFKVSARNGQIGQSKRMSGSGGWDAFEMTAGITHADSGGPVLDVQGHVVGINMGVANADLKNPLRLAVPINLAKEMLAKAGIKLDPGKGSAHWEQALRYYADGKYEASLEQLKIVRRIQEGETAVLTGRQASWYVKDMTARCLQKLGKIR